MKAPGAPPSQAAGKCEYFCVKKRHSVLTLALVLMVFSCAFCVTLVTLTLKSYTKRNTF